MPTNEHTDPMDLKLNEVKIKFVGPAVRKALAKGGIRTVADLAGSSLAEIESILEHEVPAPTRTAEKIAEMIREAQELLATQTSLASPENQLSKVPEFTLFFNYGFVEDDKKRWRALIHPHADGDRPEPPTWYPDPDDEGYTVRFERLSDEGGQSSWRTVVYNGKSLEETDITGWTPDKWWSWIAQKALLTDETLPSTAQLKEDVELMPVSVDDEPSAVDLPQAEKAIRITHFGVQLPSEKHANTLVADVVFEISENLLVQQPLQCQVEVLYVNLENNVSFLGGHDSKQLKPKQRTYESKVEFAMPQVGRYQPRCIVLLLPTGEYGDNKEANIFKIVPTTAYAN